MKRTFALGVVLASALAVSPALAKQHRAPVADDTMASSYSHASPSQVEVVTGSGSHVIADPDQNIRTQLLRDPDPSGF